MEVFILILVNLANIVSVWLAAKNNRLTWGFGFVAVTITAALFFMSGHYMSFAFNAYSAIICIIGHFRWKSSTKENDKRICWGKPYLPVLVCVALSVFIYLIDQDLSNNPWLDSIGTSVSIVAAYLLVKQDVNSWVLYVLSDIIYVYLGMVSGNIEYAIIYGVMLGLAVYGTREYILIYKSYSKQPTAMH